MPSIKPANYLKYLFGAIMTMATSCSNPPPASSSSPSDPVPPSYPIAAQKLGRIVQKKSQSREQKVKEILTDNLNSTASLIETNMTFYHGIPEPVFSENGIFDFYLNGFTLKDSFSDAMKIKLGGKEEERIARDLLEKAFEKFEKKVKGDPSRLVPCDTPVGNGIVNVSQCYLGIAKDMRQLSSYL